MRLLQLLKAYVRMNIQEGMAYRADMVLTLVMNLLWLGWELISLQIIFTNTSSISGWGMGELVALLGVWRLAHTLMSVMIWPNTNFFNNAVRTGAFDYNLLQPVNSQLQVSLSRVNVLRLWELALAAILIVVGMRMGGRGTDLAHAAGFLALAGAGIAVLYSLWIVLISFTFWFIKFDNNVSILQAFLETGRYPATVYPAWLRFIVTFLIPIAVATTVPLQALRGELALVQVVMYLGIGAASLAIASGVWKAGVKRYSGASS
jgi:ABC-2 type transport system permease protein